VSRISVVLLALALAGCTPPPRVHPGVSVRELAGTWQGRLATDGANAAATVAIREDGAYTGTLHLEGGDRPFTGAIVMVPPGQLRFHGTYGDGTVVVTPRTGPPVAVHFVPDGGGGGGSLSRVR
jgi:hypothetical protein